jgi:dolichol-phosphate mannosyltransferase
MKGWEMKVVIIVPTYNERKNIGRLIEELEAQFVTVRHDMHILVVDDTSPDGTADLVKSLMSSRKNLHLITGKKEGLGAAYVRGMGHALGEIGADAVFEMDADFSHKPEDVPRLLAALENGADFVIGSRYVPGGSIPPEWGKTRKLISRYGNIVARYVAGIYQVKDCTAGFRAISAPLLRQINPKNIRVQGYAFQVALLHEAVIRSAVVREVPVTFIDRTAGESKLGFRDIAEFMINAWWIRIRNTSTFIKFLLVGATGVIVNLGAFIMLLNLGLNKYLASPIAIQLSIFSNFLLNNFWTFKWRKTADPIQIRGVKFNIVSLASLAISYISFILLSVTFPHIHPATAQFIGIIPATVINYLGNSYWTFRHSPERDQADK